MTVSADADVITAVSFDAPAEPNPSPLTQEAVAQLSAYFAGRRRNFDLPLAPRGTPFQTTVWAQLQLIPFGETCAYGDIARRLDNPKAVRAVGAANGRNPIAVIIPCHRVIGNNGTLTGYAGGLDRKAWLLQHEGVSFKQKPSRTETPPQMNLFPQTGATESPQMDNPDA